MNHVYKNGAMCLCLMMMVLVSGQSLAQRGPGGESGRRPSPPSVSEMVSTMKQALNLTDEQAAKVTTIIQEEIAQMESLMKSENPESGRSQMEAIHEQTEAQLAAVLTAEQLAQWKNNKPQRSQKGGGTAPSSERNNSSGASGSSVRSTSGSGIW